jgi:hypothetical protein
LELDKLDGISATKRKTKMGDKEEAKVDLKYSIPGITPPDPETIYASPFHGWVINRRGRSILQLSPTPVVKYGPHVTENEAKAVILIDKNALNVPVPKVLAYYILRGYVEGESLKKSWGI